MFTTWIGTLRFTRTSLFLCCFVSFGAGAHHSRATFFDMSRTVEVEGEITRVQWRHPHVRYWVQADPAYGGAEWELETTPPSLLERQGIPNEDRSPFSLVEYPLTESAAAVAAEWDPVTGIEIGCKGKDMPWIMASNWPFELVDEGESIRLLAEEFDRVRVIHLAGPPAEITPSPMGYSVGHWDEGDLIVTTTHINSRQLGREGIPLSEDVEIHERFVLSADQRRLEYEMTVIDPATFTEPVTMTNYWLWQPGEAVKPYNCIETPGSWTTLDRSEFTPER